MSCAEIIFSLYTVYTLHNTQCVYYTYCSWDINSTQKKCKCFEFGAYHKVDNKKIIEEQNK